MSGGSSDDSSESQQKATKIKRNNSCKKFWARTKAYMQREGDSGAEPTSDHRDQAFDVCASQRRRQSSRPWEVRQLLRHWPLGYVLQPSYLRVWRQGELRRSRNDWLRGAWSQGIEDGLWHLRVRFWSIQRGWLRRQTDGLMKTSF